MNEHRKLNLQRKDTLDWDETYMILAEMVAMLRSKDPSTQVGAFIANSEHRPISFGYNGAVNGWSDDTFPWSKDDPDPINTKYPFVVHAERNCILNAPRPIPSDSTLYVSLFPCNNCAQEIAQAGIKRLVYRERRETDDNRASDLILQHAGVECIQLPSLDAFRLVKLILKWSGHTLKELITSENNAGIAVK